MQSKAKPYLSVVIAIACAAAWLVPGLDAWLIYDRQLVLNGEVWRVGTAPLAHLSGQHLAWNLVVFLAASAAAEVQGEPGLKRTLLASALLPGLFAIAAQPDLSRYGGLSGVATGVVVLLALRGLQAREASMGSRTLWLLVLGLLLAKTVYELACSTALLAAGPGAGWRPLVSAHGFGIVAGWWGASGAGRAAVDLARPTRGPR